MSDETTTTAKPILKVPFSRFTANEKWCGCRFKVPDFRQRLQSYGATPELAEARMLEILDQRYGRGNYLCEPHTWSALAAVPVEVWAKPESV